MIKKYDRVAFYFDWLWVGYGDVEAIRGQEVRILFTDYRNKSYTVMRRKSEIWKVADERDGVSPDYFLLLIISMVSGSIGYFLWLIIRSH